MLQIGDIVCLKPFGETLYTITGVMRTPGPQYEPVKDPEKHPSLGMELDMT